DLEDLLGGLIRFNKVSSSYDLHPVLTAACVAFGFVYIHPFEDGNGRIHRFLMHHVLAERYFTPEQIVFPISSVILDDVARYKDVLEYVSRPLLDWIRWKSTDRGNIVVQNNTADYYRYFDATAHSEYLFRCIERAVDKDLPEELAFLESRDKFHHQVTSIVDMPERLIDLLLHFLRQGHGRLSSRAQRKEFAALSKLECTKIERIYADLFP
nr:Fic family protein [Hyphomicrobiales bacterium]